MLPDEKSKKPFTFKRFLLFLSKTDEHILEHCTQQAIMTQVSIGTMVLFTGVFAFLSSFFAIEQIFHTDIAAVLVGVVYSIGIMTFDRELVAVYDKKSLFLRLPFALVLGLVLSFPIEMKLFEGRIVSQIELNVNKRNEYKVNEIKEIEKKYTDEKKVVSNYLTSLREDEKRVSGEYTEESRIVTVGPKARALDAELKKIRKTIEKQEEELNLIGPTEIEKSRISKIRNEITNEVGGSRDLLSQAEALEKVKENSPTASTVSIMLRIFFVLIEMFPILVKFFIPNNEYYVLLEGRRKINVKKIEALLKKDLKDIEEDPEGEMKKDHSSRYEKTINI